MTRGSAHSWRQKRRMSRRGREGGAGRVRNPETLDFLGPPQRLFRRVDLALAAPQRRIDAALLEQRLVGSPLGDEALVQDQDLVGVDHGRQPVRDYDGGAAA